MAKFCSNCGKELPENAAACPTCPFSVRSSLILSPILISAYILAEIFLNFLIKKKSSCIIKGQR